MIGNRYTVLVIGVIKAKHWQIYTMREIIEYFENIKKEPNKGIKSGSYVLYKKNIYRFWRHTKNTFRCYWRCISVLKNKSFNFAQYQK